MTKNYEIAFNTNFVASLTGASIAQLNSWDKQGLVCPSVLKSEGRGTIRLYSFKDIVEAKTVAYLRGTKISLADIKLAVNYLRNTFDFKSPLSELVLISNGKDVLCAPSSEINDIYSQWLAANRGGQLVMPYVVPFGAITQDINSAIKKYNERIEQAEKQDKSKMVSLKDIEDKVFGVSGKVHRQRA